MAREDVDITQDGSTPTRQSAWRRVGSFKVPLACALLVAAALAGGWNYAAGQGAQADARRQRSFIVRSDHLVSAMKDLARLIQRDAGSLGYVCRECY